MFFPISPYVIGFDLYILVICIDFVVCNTRVKTLYSIFRIDQKSFLGSLFKKLLFLSFSLIFFLFFSLAKHPMRMISQRMSN